MRQAHLSGIICMGGLVTNSGQPCQVAYIAIDHQDIKYCPPCDDSRSDDLPSDSGVAAGDAHGVVDEGGGGLAGEQLLHPEVGREGGNLHIIMVKMGIMVVRWSSWSSSW